MTIHDARANFSTDRTRDVSSEQQKPVEILSERENEGVYQKMMATRRL